MTEQLLKFFFLPRDHRGSDNVGQPPWPSHATCGGSVSFDQVTGLKGSNVVILEISSFNVDWTGSWLLTCDWSKRG